MNLFEIILLIFFLIVDYVTAYSCFQSKSELQYNGIQQYQSQECATNPGCDVIGRYGPIKTWCFSSSLTDMSRLFAGLDSFNEDISGWDVSRVTNMRDMFKGASSFHGDGLFLWSSRVYQVTNMASMFEGATSFNGNINGWNVQAVTNMSRMFAYASSFNQNLPNWNVAMVRDMSHMFDHASAFNGAIGGWDVTNVINMEAMFMAATSFNADISEWNVANVNNMKTMFYAALSFNFDLCAWGQYYKDDVIYLGMFANSGCPNVYDPVYVPFTSDPASPFTGPYCHACETTAKDVCKGCETSMRSLYLGCFDEDESDRAFPYNVGVEIPGGDASFARPTCRNKCFEAGYTYAGATMGEPLIWECWCGNGAFDKHGKSACYGPHHIVVDGLTVSDNCQDKCSDFTDDCMDWCPDATKVYLGCFKDTSDRALPYKVTPPLGPSKWNTIQGCEDKCSEAGYDYAGLQYEGECWCGNDGETDGDYDKYGQEPDGCNCRNFDNVGGWRNCVYGPPPPSKVYLGCFKDTSPDRALPSRVLDPLQWNTIQGCQDKCSEAGYDYAGLQYKGECWCGNDGGTDGDYDKYGQEPDGCNCKDFENVGGWRNCVYGPPSSNPFRHLRGRKN